MMVRLIRQFTVALLFVGLAPALSAAHVGSPNVIYEGKAGQYDIRVIVRVPSVVPGLADVTVRVLRGDARDVRIRPVYWRAGVNGSPSPDPAKPVRGVPGLYSGQLWLMARGAYSVYVTVDGPEGTGTARVPVMSIATGRLGMSPALGASLVALSILLLAGLITIIYAAAGESVVEPGRLIDKKTLTRARTIGVLAVPVLALAVFGGARWWKSVDSTYQSRMYRPWPVQASMEYAGGRSVLRLTTLDSAGEPAAIAPLLPDHGKLMHLFLIDSARMATFAHLHPMLATPNLFRGSIPPLPPGTYRIYGDVTAETGQTHTLVSVIRLTRDDSIQAALGSTDDPDDSWYVGPGVLRNGNAITSYPLDDRSTLEWLPDSTTLRAGAESSLRFRVRDPQGAPATLEPYLGMTAHAVVARADGSLFVHLHPAGTISFASQEAFALRDGGDTTASGRLRLAPESTQHHMVPLRSEFSFPYVFPRPGSYRMWVQVKHDGRVLTGVYDVTVGGEGE